MQPTRIFLFRYRILAMLLLLLALCMKLLVPAGMMIGTNASKQIVVQICTGTGMAEKTLDIPMESAPDKQHKGSLSGDTACSYSALSYAATGVNDAFILAIALAFILALGFAAPPLLLHRAAPRLRPPLRGPPRLI
jgi:Protein of unknown function (DUF2946)